MHKVEWVPGVERYKQKQVCTKFPTFVSLQHFENKERPVDNDTSFSMLNGIREKRLAQTRSLVLKRKGSSSFFPRRFANSIKPWAHSVMMLDANFHKGDKNDKDIRPSSRGEQSMVLLCGTLRLLARASLKPFVSPSVYAISSQSNTILKTRIFIATVVASPQSVPRSAGREQTNLYEGAVASKRTMQIQ